MQSKNGSKKSFHTWFYRAKSRFSVEFMQPGGILSGAHDYLFPKVMELLRKKGVEDILVLGGGIIPDEDIPALKKAGIPEVFGPGTTTEGIISYIRDTISSR